MKTSIPKQYRFLERFGDFLGYRIRPLSQQIRLRCFSLRVLLLAVSGALLPVFLVFAWQPFNGTVTPLQNQESVASNTLIGVNYTGQTLDANSVGVGTSFFVHPSLGGGLPFSNAGLSVSDGNISLSHTNPFLAGERVEVTATSNILNDGGDNAPPLVWQFRIASGLASQQFTQGQVVAPGNVYVSRTGDLDGDGDLDVFFGREGGDQVWIKDGSTGLFNNSNQVLGAATLRTTDAALADVDHDGDLDIVVAKMLPNGTTQPLPELWINNGAGNFGSAPVSLQCASCLSQAIAMGDIDGDGDLDILVGTSRDTRVLYNKGGNQNGMTREFADSGQILNGGLIGGGSISDVTAVALGDLDNDFDLDAFVVTRNNQPDEVWLNDGTGQFNIPVEDRDNLCPAIFLAPIGEQPLWPWVIWMVTMTWMPLWVMFLP